MQSHPESVTISFSAQFEYQPIALLEVRPFFHNEQKQWDEFVDKHHYLGLRAIVGEALRYVAILDGTWVALVDFGAGALKNRHRDGFIGWKPAMQWPIPQTDRLFCCRLKVLLRPLLRFC